MPASPVTPAAQSATARTDWIAVTAVIAAGVLVSIQVGKLPPLLTRLREEFGLDLVLGGLLASSFMLIGAVLGILAGFASDRIGSRRALVAGVSITALGCAAGAMATGTALLLAARLVEGLGFVLTVVCGPSLLNGLTRPDQRQLALGLWSTYMPLGVTLGMLGALTVGGLFDWRGLWLALALLLLAAAFVIRYLIRGAQVAAVPRRFQAAPLKRPGPWLLAACFACYTTQWFAIVTWIPTYLREGGVSDDLWISLGAALVVAINVIGNTSSAALMHRGVPRWLIIAVISLAMGILGMASFADGVSLTAKIAFAMAASGFGGMLPAAVLASVPAHTREPGEIATVNGVVTQLLNIGSFIGPPALAALVAQFGGWSQGRWLLLAAGLLGCTLALLLRRVEARSAAA